MATTYASLYYHLVFSTKNRAPMIGTPWISELHRYLGGTVKQMDATALAVGGVSDHVHMLLSLRTTHCVADFVREVKKSSSTWSKLHYVPGFRWQDNYAVFTVSASALKDVRHYVESQQAHHRHVDSRDELLTLCQEAGIEVRMEYFE